MLQHAKGPTKEVKTIIFRQYLKRQEFNTKHWWRAAEHDNLFEYSRRGTKSLYIVSDITSI